MAPTPGDGEELDASLPVPGLPSERHLLPPPHPSLCSGSKRKTIAVGTGAAPMIAGSSSSSHSQTSPSVASADNDIVNPSNVVEVDDSNEVDVSGKRQKRCTSIVWQYFKRVSTAVGRAHEFSY